MRRIAPVEVADLDPETAEMLSGINFGRKGNRPMNAFLTMAAQPRYFRRYLPYGIHTEWSSLSPRERELVILRTSHICKCEYEITQHAKVGLRAGLSPEEIERLAEDGVQPGWAPDDAALVNAVNELCSTYRITDGTWTALAARWPEDSLMDIVFTIGLYVQSSMALNAFGVELDD